MRSPVRIDDNLMEALRTRSEEEGLSMTRMLNRLLRSGLAAETAAARRPRFRQATARMGRARIDLDKALSLAAALEDEEIVRMSGPQDPRST